MSPFLLSAVILGTSLIPAFGATPVTGAATSCGGLASCSFTLSDTSGAGTASTSAFVGGYVGQSPLPFSGGSVSFQLPGEAQVTYAAGVYAGEAVLESGSGSSYETTGTFSAVDANTGQVVTGTTVTVITITGHSGRGGGNTYTLDSGTITMTPTGLDGTSTTITCSPSSLVSTGTSFTKCTVTVKDLNPSSTHLPTGQVTFSSTGVYGRFYSPVTHNSTCRLARGWCVVYFRPSADMAGTIPIYATYAGDSAHDGSTGSTLLYLTAPA